MGRQSNARSRIIRTASNLFWCKGFETTSVSEILAETGLGAGSFYWFFDSKEELLLAVLESYRGKLDRMIRQPALAGARDPVGRILLVLGFYRRHLLENGFALGCPIGNIVLELGNRYPAVRRKTEELFQTWRDMIAECLVTGGGLSGGLSDIDSLAMFILTVMEGGILQARAQENIRPFDESVLHLRRYLETLLEPGAL